MDTIIQILARELGRSEAHVENVVRLIDEGNTIPFIARYRKELHGSMDDTALRKLEDRLTYLRNLDQRRQEVKSAIQGQEKLTPELAAAIDSVSLASYGSSVVKVEATASTTSLAANAGVLRVAAASEPAISRCRKPSRRLVDFIDTSFVKCPRGQGCTQKAPERAWRATKCPGPTSCNGASKGSSPSARTGLGISSESSGRSRLRRFGSATGTASISFRV